VVSQAFSEQALRETEPMILRNVDTFVRELLRGLPKSQWDSKTWSEPVDLSERSNYFTLDVVGAFGFGQSFEMQSKVENRYISKAIADAAPIIGVYYQYPGLADLKIERLLRRIGGGSLAWTLQRFSALVKAMVVRRMSMEKDAVRDLFSFMVDAKDPETGIGVSQDEIWAESRLFIIAGRLKLSYFKAEADPIKAPIQLPQH
jgi:cytochrome P450